MQIQAIGCLPELMRRFDILTCRLLLVFQAMNEKTPLNDLRTDRSLCKDLKWISNPPLSKSEVIEYRKLQNCTTQWSLCSTARCICCEIEGLQP